MLEERSVKYAMVTQPAAIVDDAALVTTAIDCGGFDFLEVQVLVGTTDIGMTTLKLQESDDDGASDAYADITGAVFGTSTDIDGATSALPSATDDGKVFVFSIDLRARKRYIDVSAVVGNGTAGGYYAVLARLSRAKERPTTKTEKNAGGYLTA